MLLADRVTAITGGGSGLGREMAVVFAGEGARVAVLDLDLAAASDVVGELPPSASGPHVAIEVDVASASSVETAFSSVREQAGHLDVLVNSAGIREIVDLFELSLDEWQRVIGVNLTGTFLCSRAAASLMLNRGSGSIINISSVAGLVGFHDRPAYAASKAGVIGLTRSLTKDLSPKGIRVNVICPGLMRTPLTERFYEDQQWVAGIPEHVPLGRPGVPADVAQAALFLASDMSAFVSGVSLPVDGGFMAAGSFGKGTTVNAPGRNDETTTAE